MALKNGMNWSQRVARFMIESVKIGDRNQVLVHFFHFHLCVDFEHKCGYKTLMQVRMPQ